MNRTVSYVHEIAKLDVEIKRLQSKLKELRNEKKLKQKYLYEAMKRHNEAKVGSFSLKSLEKSINSIPVKRKKLRDKRKDAINLFRTIGIPHPEQFYNEFQATQKV